MPTLEQPAGSPSAAPKCCLKCGKDFNPRRKDQKYCAKTCAKAATRNNSRGNRTREYKAMNEQHRATVRQLEAALYGAPPRERLGVMKRILECATGDDTCFKSADVKRVLTDPKLLRACPSEAHLFYRRAPGAYRTISQAANAYTQKFFGVSVKTYLKETREGNIREDREVNPTVDQRPVPQLSKIKKVKCWHQPLSMDKMNEDARRFSKDMARVDRIVSEVQARIDGNSSLAA